MSASETTLYIRGFSRKVTAQELSPEFEAFGRVKRVLLPATRTPEGAPYAFVEYEEREAAEKALAALHDQELKSDEGSKLIVEWARSQPRERSSFGPRYGAYPPRDYDRYGPPRGYDRYGPPRGYDRYGPPPPRGFGRGGYDRDYPPREYARRDDYRDRGYPPRGGYERRDDRRGDRYERRDDRYERREDRGEEQRGRDQDGDYPTERQPSRSRSPVRE